MDDDFSHRIDRMNGCAVVGKWLLIVFAVPALFAGVASLILNFFSSYGCGRSVTYSSTVQMIWALEFGLTSFHQEYHHFPTASKIDILLTSDDVLMRALMLDESLFNPRKIIFLSDLPDAEKDRAGIIRDFSTGAGPAAMRRAVDAWGMPYYVILDADDDGQVGDPTISDAPGSPMPLPMTLDVPIAIYSAGPDRDPKTWTDNIRSW